MPGAFHELPRGSQKPAKCQNLAPKGSRPGFGRTRPFPNRSRRRFYLPLGKPANCQNLAPNGSRPFPSPSSPRRRCDLQVGRLANCPHLVPDGSRPGFGGRLAVSKWSQKALFLAGREARKLPKSGSERLPTGQTSFLGQAWAPTCAQAWWVTPARFLKHF